jgi:hypothetical protein
MGMMLPRLSASRLPFAKSAKELANGNTLKNTKK